MPTNPDFRDLLQELSAAGAEFIIVGAHAVVFYAAPRYTKDLDVWVKPTKENSKRVYEALRKFGADVSDLTVDDLSTEGTIFQIGIEPNRIDVITKVEGLEFSRAWKNTAKSTYSGVAISILGKEDLILNKRKVARAQDLLDVKNLEMTDDRKKR